MTDIQELLACDDLLKHKWVVEAYDCLVAKGKWQHRYVKRCGFRDVTCEKCQHTVQRTWHEMNDFDPPHDCSVPSIPIPGSLADVAFEMRNACNAHDWFITLVRLPKFKEGGSLGERFAIALKYATEEDWIVAAVLAWEAAK